MSTDLDDVLNLLSPLLSKNRWCILPHVLKRTACDRQGEAGCLLVHVTLRVAFQMVSTEDGSDLIVEAYGEALDSGDKATAKAMSAAYKSAMLQTFCIPVSGTEDADHESHKAKTRTHLQQPVQGWEQWSRDIADIVNVCESGEAISTVQKRNRELLKAISRERPDLYTELGRSFTDRRKFLSRPCGHPEGTKEEASNSKSCE